MTPTPRRVQKLQPSGQFEPIEYDIVDHKIREVGGFAFAVYVVLRRHRQAIARADSRRGDDRRFDRGEVFAQVRIDIIAEKLACSENTARAALKVLEAAGWIRIERPDRIYGNTYVLGDDDGLFVERDVAFGSNSEGPDPQNLRVPTLKIWRSLLPSPDQTGDQTNDQTSVFSTPITAEKNEAPKAEDPKPVQRRIRRLKPIADQSQGKAQAIAVEPKVEITSPTAARSPLPWMVGAPSPEPAPIVRRSFRAPAAQSALCPPAAIESSTPASVPEPEPEPPKRDRASTTWTNVIDTTQSRRKGGETLVEANVRDKGTRRVAAEELRHLESALAKRDARPADSSYDEGQYSAAEAVAYWRWLYFVVFDTEDLSTQGSKLRTQAAKLFAQRVATEHWGNGSSQRVFAYLRAELSRWQKDGEANDWKWGWPSFELFLRNEKSGAPRQRFVNWSNRQRQG